MNRTELVSTYLSGLRGQPIKSGGEPTWTERLSLNPLFVEALMGWPIGWTGFGSQVTGSFRSWRLRHSSYLRNELGLSPLSVLRAEPMVTKVTPFVGLPAGPFSILLADPPWLYDDARTRKSAGMARSAYECLSVDAICALPVADVAAKDSVLALWSTCPKLAEALRVMAAWGFKYVTTLCVWGKTYRDGSVYSGLGHYTKSGSEFLLLGRRGKTLPRLRRDIRQLVLHPVGRHSEKPAVFRSVLTDLFGDLPRLELFARDCGDGWEAWGAGLPVDALL